MKYNIYTIYKICTDLDLLGVHDLDFQEMFDIEAVVESQLCSILVHKLSVFFSSVCNNRTEPGAQIIVPNDWTPFNVHLSF